MTEKDRQEAAIRKAVREIAKPLEDQIERMGRTISALSSKLKDSQRQLNDARRRLTECQRRILE